MEGREDAGHIGDGGTETVDVVSRVARETQRDHGLEGHVERAEIDVGMDARDDAALAQHAQPAAARRLRHADPTREFGVRHSAVLEN